MKICVPSWHEPQLQVSVQMRQTRWKEKTHLSVVFQSPGEENTSVCSLPTYCLKELFLGGGDMVSEVYTTVQKSGLSKIFSERN